MGLAFIRGISIWKRQKKKIENLSFHVYCCHLGYQKRKYGLVIQKSCLYLHLLSGRTYTYSSGHLSSWLWEKYFCLLASSLSSSWLSLRCHSGEACVSEGYGTFYQTLCRSPLLGSQLVRLEDRSSTDLRRSTFSEALLLGIQNIDDFTMVHNAAGNYVFHYFTAHTGKRYQSVVLRLVALAFLEDRCDICLALAFWNFTCLQWLPVYQEQEWYNLICKFLQQYLGPRVVWSRRLGPV